MLEQITNGSDFLRYSFLDIIIVFFIVLGIAVICVKFTKSKNPFWSKESTGSAYASYALEDLKEKYSKGEITREEFDNMKEDLG